MTKFAASTHSGLKRLQNEDCYAADAELGLWLVADGIGGHAFGEVASAIVKAQVTEAYAGGKTLTDAIRGAHSAVLKEISDRDENLGMGSTVVALALNERRYQIAWVGDSRAYSWNGKTLRQLSQDHSHVAELLKQGLISGPEATNHPERHVLTQSIGVSNEMALQPGTVSGQLKEGEQILLCSDGLTDELSDANIEQLLRGSASVDSQVDSLISAALTAGGRDNITVVMVGESAATRSPGIVTPDLEATQNTARPIMDGQPLARSSHTKTLWLVLAVIIAMVVISWI